MVGWHGRLKRLAFRAPPSTAGTTEAAERYIPGVHHYKAVPERFFSFPYGGSYIKRAKRAFGNPYVNPYYGSYYAPQYYYGNYRSPYYW